MICPLTQRHSASAASASTQDSDGPVPVTTYRVADAEPPWVYYAANELSISSEVRRCAVGGRPRVLLPHSGYSPNTFTLFIFPWRCCKILADAEKCSPTKSYSSERSLNGARGNIQHAVQGSATVPRAP